MNYIFGLSQLTWTIYTAYVSVSVYTSSTGRKATCAATVGFMPGVLPGILSVIGVAILAQSSFELDAVQITNG